MTYTINEARALPPVTHEQAREIAQRFIDAWFDNRSARWPRASIPADERTDDDLLLIRYIEEQRALVADLEAVWAELADIRALSVNPRGEECICANRAKVESMVHPYCPRHAGGDPGPGIGACESCDGPEQPAVVVVGVGTRSATRLCLDCLLAHALNVRAQRDSAIAELAVARAAMPTAGEAAQLLWALTYLRTKAPISGETMTEEIVAFAVARRLSAYHAAHHAASPAAEVADAYGSAPDLPEPCARCSEALCECGTGLAGGGGHE